MLKQSCALCKVVGAVAIIGCLNWGLIAAVNINAVERFFGAGTTVTRVIYGVVGLAGLMLLLSYFIVCPVCKKA